METKPKKKVKYALWFLVVLVVLLWTLLTQLFALCSWLPWNWGNINLWLKILANCIATFGGFWVLGRYIKDTKKQALRRDRIEKAIGRHPEFKDILNDIAGDTK